MEFTWVTGAGVEPCIPCGVVRDSERVFESRTAEDVPVVGTRCTVCGSVTVHGAEMEYEADDPFIDRYLQAEGGIDAIVANLYRVDAPAAARFLDVGANYGFGVRWARDMLGWRAVGVEPSYAGRRGARELGVEILGQYVTADTMLDERFDVILASEVVEHLSDPGAFITVLRDHLAPGGTLVLTTPAAEVITPATAVEGMQAVGTGGHVFLFSAPALADFLRRHGFGSVAVARDGMAMSAVATIEPDRALDARARGPQPAEVATFLQSLVTDPASPPVLATAMAVRHYRALVNLGQDAPAVEHDMVERVRTTTGLDLAAPAALAAALPTLDTLPLLIAPAAFAAGMVRVVHRRDWAQAVDYFALAEAAVAENNRRSHSHDGDARLILAQSRAHRLLALLHSDPAAAVAEWRRLLAAGELVDAAEWTVRLFVEAHALGRPQLFDVGLDAISDAIGELGAGDTEQQAVAAVDGAHLLARAAIARGDRWCATQWISIAEAVMQVRAERLAPDWAEQATRMLAATRTDLQPLRAEAIPSLVPMPGHEHESILWASAERDEVPGGVSVIMALYNGERYVVEALESVAAQTHAPLEVIIVDDGSHDDAVARIQSLPLPFSPRILRQGNAGQSAARNTGIRAARGGYIAFLDQDDAWRPDHLARLIAAIEADDRLAWVFGDFDLVDESGSTRVQSYLTTTGVLLDRRTIIDLVRTDIMALPSASILRRSALVAERGFDRRLSGYEDDELAIRLFRAGWRIAPALDVRARYRTHDANASGSVAFLRSRLVFLQLLLTLYPGGQAGASAPEAAAERLLRSTTAEYFVALVARDDALARTIAWATERMLPISEGVSPYHRSGLRLMRRPRLMRAAMQVAGALPGPVRRRVLPPMALQAHEQLRRRRRATGVFTLDGRPDWLR